MHPFTPATAVGAALCQTTRRFRAGTCGRRRAAPNCLPPRGSAPKRHARPPALRWTAASETARWSGAPSAPMRSLAPPQPSGPQHAERRGRMPRSAQEKRKHRGMHDTIWTPPNPEYVCILLVAHSRRCQTRHAIDTLNTQMVTKPLTRATAGVSADKSNTRRSAKSNRRRVSLPLVVEGGRAAGT